MVVKLSTGSALGDYPWWDGTSWIATGSFMGVVTGSQFKSTAATGTAPLTVASTTKVTNLNADTTDGYSLDQDVQSTASPTFVKATLSQATGTAPLTVTSTTVVTNLNADKVDGSDSSAFAAASHAHAATDVTSGTLSTDRYSAYSDLDAETKIGSGATQVSSGSHAHSHTTLTDIGTNTHSTIDTHIAATGTSVHGLGSIATQASGSIGITGGNITGITDLAPADGGTGISTYAKGDLIWASAANILAALNSGSASQVLITTPTGLAWSTSGSGGVTDATFVTLSSSTGLSAERVLATGSALTMVDGGANNNITLSVVQGAIDHGSIAGLSDDDHTQYTRKDTLTTKGDVYVASAASTPARLGSGSDGQVLRTSATGLEWTTTGSYEAAHNILSSTHLDALAGSVTRGNLIIGSGSSTKWTQLSSGSSGQYLGAGGADVAWVTINTGSIASQAANNVSITGGSITGITDLAVADGGTGLGTYTKGDLIWASAANTLAQLNSGSTGQILRLDTDSNLPSWSNDTSPASFIIYSGSPGATYYAINGTTGKIDYSGSVASTVIQNSIDALTGGKIFFKPARYILTTPITLDHGIKLIGSGESDTDPFSNNNGTILEFQLSSPDYCIKTPSYDSPGCMNPGLEDMVILSRSTHANLGLLLLNIVSAFWANTARFQQGVSGAPCVELKTLDGNIVGFQGCSFFGKNENGTNSGSGIHATTSVNGGGIDHLRLINSDLFYMRDYGIRIERSGNYNIISGCHIGYGFSTGSYMIDITSDTYQSQFVISDNFIEMTNDTGSMNPDTFSSGNGKIIIYNPGTNGSTLYLKNNTIVYSRATNLTDWSSLSTINNVGSGVIERDVACYNMTTHTPHFGTLGLTTANIGAKVITSEPLTTKGDIYVATGSAGLITRLGVGADGKVLVADSAQVTGLNWAPTGSIAYQSAASVAITGGSITGITDLAVADGGTGLGAFAKGDLIWGSAANTLAALASGSDGTVLKTTSTGLAWSATGSMASQSAASVAITGGSITGITDLAVADGGTGLGTYAKGDLIWASAANTLAALNSGSSGQVLRTSSTGLEWSTTGSAGTMASQSASNVSITGGNIIGLSMQSNINLITGSNNTGSGIFFTGTVGETVNIGDVLYYSGSGQYWSSDADSGTTMPVVALAMETKVAGNTCGMLKYGYFHNDGWNWTQYAGTGSFLYASTTTGSLTQTAPSGTTDQVQLVAYIYSPDVIFFNPSMTMVEIT